MKYQRLMKWGLLIGGPMFMLQYGGCATVDSAQAWGLTVMEVLQTVFLGVTAAGAYGILRNI